MSNTKLVDLETWARLRNHYTFDEYVELRIKIPKLLYHALEELTEYYTSKLGFPGFICKKHVEQFFSLVLYSMLLDLYYANPNDMKKIFRKVKERIDSIVMQRLKDNHQLTYHNH